MTSWSEIRDGLKDIHETHVEAVERDIADPIDCGDGPVGDFFRRRRAANVAVATAAALALSQLDGMSTMQSGTHTYGRERVAR